MKDILIGIDAGTSVIKSVAFSLDGEQLASHSIANHYDTLDQGGVEQDMARTWSDTAASLLGLKEAIPDIAQRTAAVAVTGQGDGTWLIDANGEPVAPAWLWLDARASNIAENLSAGAREHERYARTVTGLAACQQGVQLNWMKRHMPELLLRSATAMHCKDWLYFKLTGTAATDPSEGCFTFGDVRRRQYSDTVIDILGLAQYRHLLPPLLDGSCDYLPLTTQAASATGLLAGTPICLGFVDIVCTALGAGLYDRQIAAGCTIVGSTGVHMRLRSSADDIVQNDAGSGYTVPLPAPGIYAQMQSNMASTLNIDWLLKLARDVLSNQGVTRNHADLIPCIDDWIQSSRPAQLLYQPYISTAGERGPFIDCNARAGFVGLSTRHGFADLVRAVVEGLALAARDCYGAMGDLPDEVRITGGAARSPALRQIFGAVLDTRIRTSSREEAGAAGAAMMAAVAIGAYPDMDACVRQWVIPLLGESEAPDQELAGEYRSSYPIYLQTRKALQNVWAALANRGET